LSIAGELILKAGVWLEPGITPCVNLEKTMTDHTLMNLTRRMEGETTTCDQCGKSYAHLLRYLDRPIEAPDNVIMPLFVGIRDTGIGEDMVQAFCSWECAADWFGVRAGR
jgi:hypothetical protein